MNAGPRGRQRLLLIFPALLAGCAARGVETEYGRSMSKSVNGTGAFAELLRSRGHEVRAASRLDDRLENRADVIIRFAPYPGPPEEAEAEWYQGWLLRGQDRRLVYILRDYDAEHDYWKAAQEALGDGGSEDLRERIQARVQETRVTGELPPAPKKVGAEDFWFSMDPKEGSADACKSLEGPWSRGIDAQQAGLVARKAPAATVENVLLSGDGKVLAMEWSVMADNPRLMAVANGSFLLNAAMLNPARRPLAGRLADWIGDRSGRVVFVEGSNLTGKNPGGFHLTPPMYWVVAHLAAFGILGALALATRLGPPRPEEPAGAERPVAHAEALGDLLAKSKDAGLARAQLEAYRRWRQPAAIHPPRH
ncbi:MAG: DUF4350 domain-containing protein [Isosphaeraceae bacterium]